MEPKKRDAERTRDEILQAARHLFAENDISSVSIRDIAKEAGVSHGLVQQYFGTRDAMISAIIRSEVERLAQAPVAMPTSLTGDSFAALAARLKQGMEQFADYAMLITRAELAGIEPEKMLDSRTPTPIMQLATAISELQAQCSGGVTTLDARWVSAYVNAALFAFSTMAPWLVTSAGLSSEDSDAALDQVVDISVALIALASGVQMPGDAKQ